jgi:translation elongation factor EF-1alpha
MADNPIGSVAHYFDHIGVAVVKLEKGSISVGDKIKIQAKSGDFIQEVTSMQIEHKAIDKAGVGDEFGLKVDQPVEKGDKVFLQK